MALIAWEDIEALAPELAGLSADRQQLVVEQVNSEVVEARWGSPAKAKIAARYLGAHLGSVLKRGGGNAPVQSVSVGGVSKSYATSVAADVSLLQSTGYGKEYVRLLKLRAPRFLVT